MFGDDFISSMEICVISGNCTHDSAIDLFDTVKYILRGELPNSSLWNIDFYRYDGISRGIKTVYRENVFSSSRFQTNSFLENHNEVSYFKASCIKDFYETKKRSILFEIQCAEDTERNNIGSFFDPTDFAYLSLLFLYLQNQNIGYKAFISGSCVGDRLYYPIDTRLYFKLRTFLLYQCTLLGTNSNMFFLRDDYKYYWVRMFNDEKYNGILNIRCDLTNIGTKDLRFGEILPLIPVNRASFVCLQEKADLKGTWKNIWSKRLNELLRNYCDKVEEEQVYNSTDIHLMFEGFLRTDSLLESIVFFTSLFYLYKDFHEKVSEIELLHERCMDYAQGLNQMIENIYYHVVCNTGGGAGSISIRIRKKEDSFFGFLSNTQENDMSGTGKNGLLLGNYIIEINIIDVCFDDNQNYGIVDKFYENVKKYYPNHSLLKTYDSLSERVMLKHMFGRERNVELEKYLNNPQIIAYHYGLQIFENAVLSNHGAIGVWSGYREDNTFFDSDKMEELFTGVHGWKHGTEYTVCIPLSLSESMDYTDSIGIMEYDILSNSCDEIEYIPDYSFSSDFGLSVDEIYKAIENPGGKNTLIEKIVKKIKNTISCECSFLVIDCADICLECQYEIVAKTAFRCLTLEEIPVNHIAIINLQNRYEVIKLFRQFAMFYNRNGVCVHTQDKSVFLVDDNAKLSLFLRGNLSDIIQDMKEQQIIGGIDENEIKILQHLGGRNGRK